MGRFIGYTIIIIIHFLVKGCNYAQMEKTRGVVIDERTFSYGRASVNRGRDIVPYPIALFKGPKTMKEVKTRIYRPEEEEYTAQPIERQMTEGGKAKLLAILDSFKDYEKTDDVKDLIKGIENGTTKFIDSDPMHHDVFDIKYEETDEYVTATPWGAYFFKRYRTGDSIDIIYNAYAPSEGIVLTFMSYWLTLRSICFIILFCIIWTGIYMMATKRYGY